MKIVLLIFFCCGLWIQSQAQVGEPVMFDQVENPNCETFLVVLDGLYQRLRDVPTDQAFVVIKGPHTSLLKKLVYEMWLRGRANQRKANISRVSIIRAAEEGAKVQIDIWVQPQEADWRPTRQSKWDFTLKARGKPFAVYSEMEQICSSGKPEMVLKEFLDANPKALGQIRIRSANKRRFNQLKRNVLTDLDVIPQHRLRFVWIRSSADYAEYWIAPPRVVMLVRSTSLAILTAHPNMFLTWVQLRAILATTGDLPVLCFNG